MQKNKRFSKELVEWGKTNTRYFPWRDESKSAYDILIAEVFLKRTTSSHVIKVYDSFIKKYPDFLTIIKSDEDILECELRTLGLQKQRTKQLKDISNFISDRYKNKIPKDENKLLDIPGIGQYIARAIQCYAFNIRSYPIDGNVQRIIARVFFHKDWKQASLERIESVYKKIQPSKNFKDFNYLILDFGSLVCRPSYPKCSECPICLICNYYKKMRKI